MKFAKWTDQICLWAAELKNGQDRTCPKAALQNGSRTQLNSSTRVCAALTTLARALTGRLAMDRHAGRSVPGSLREVECKSETLRAAGCQGDFKNVVELILQPIPERPTPECWVRSNPIENLVNPVQPDPAVQARKRGPSQGIRSEWTRLHRMPLQRQANVACVTASAGGPFWCR